MTTVSTKDVGTDAAPASSATDAPASTPDSAPPALPRLAAVSRLIQTVRWGVTVNTGNFSSVRLDAEAAVATDGSAESTLEALREWVLSQSPLNEYDRERLVDETNRLRQDERRQRNNLADATHEYNKIRKAFATLGIEPGLPSVEDLPF